MTDKELFFKYNFIYTKHFEKNQLLTELLYHNQINDQQFLPYDNNKCTILLDASYDCNAHCVYCYNANIRQHYQNKIINYKLLEELINKLGPHIRNLIFHGGEPLLLPDDYFKFIVQQKIQKQLDFPIGIQSNGILFTEEKQKLFNDLHINIGFSFDGIFNNSTRGIESTHAILNLANNNYFQKQSGIIAVITQKNIAYLIDNYKYFKEHNICSIQTHIIHEQIIGKQNNNKFLLDNNIIIFYYKQYLLYWIYDIDTPITDSFLIRLIEELFGIVAVCTDAECLGTHLHIDPDGNIGPCGYYLPEKNFGNIQTITNYHDILTNSEYIQYFYKFEKLKKKECKDCIYQKVCHGGCIELSYEIDNTFNTLNKRQCDLHKKLLDATYDIIKDLDLSNESIYNPIFLSILKNNNYYSLTEIKEIEKKGNS